MTANNEELAQKIVSGLKKYKWPRAYEDCQVTLAKAEAVIREALRSQAGAVQEWRPMSSAPKDGTLLRLLVEFEEHATEDIPDAAPTIGMNNLENNGEDEWQFAGWCWEHDHFTEGKGTVVGWLPYLSAAPPSPAADERVREWLMPDDLEQLIRFYGYVSDPDSGGYMNSKEAVKRLAELGCVKWCGGSRYEVTRFGEWIVESHAAKTPAELPLITCADFNARSHKEMTERNAALAARKAGQECPDCNGSGEAKGSIRHGESDFEDVLVNCPTCMGTGSRKADVQSGPLEDVHGPVAGEPEVKPS